MRKGQSKHTNYKLFQSTSTLAEVKPLEEKRTTASTDQRWAKGRVAHKTEILGGEGLPHQPAAMAATVQLHQPALPDNQDVLTTRLTRAKLLGRINRFTPLARAEIHHMSSALSLSPTSSSTLVWISHDVPVKRLHAKSPQTGHLPS